MSSPHSEQLKEMQAAEQNIQIDAPTVDEPHVENEAVAPAENADKHEGEPVGPTEEAPSSPMAETKTRKSRASAKKAAPTKGPSSKAKVSTKKAANATHPPWKDIIAECVHDLGEERNGVSRSTVKKFAEDRYGLEQNNMNASHLSRAIVHGEQEGIFVLPKGPSGKIKLAPAKNETTKENTKPASSSKKPASVGKKTTGSGASSPKKQESVTKTTTKKAVPAAQTKTKQAAAKAATKKVASPKKATPARKATATVTRKTAVTPTKKRAVASTTRKSVPKKATAKTTEKKRAVAKVAATKSKTRTPRAAKRKA